MALTAAAGDFYNSPNRFMGRPDPVFLPGTLDMLILKALSTEPRHGYAIAQYVHDGSRDVLRVEEGALYPALHRLELRGFVRSEWGTSENNRRAKYYRLTAHGRRELEREAAEWSRVSAAVTRIMQLA
jgi:PadR family transcriptional regulator, regulatory protein PadR